MKKQKKWAGLIIIRSVQMWLSSFAQEMDPPPLHQASQGPVPVSRFIDGLEAVWFRRIVIYQLEKWIENGKMNFSREKYFWDEKSRTWE